MGGGGGGGAHAITSPLHTCTHTHTLQLHAPIYAITIPSSDFEKAIFISAGCVNLAASVLKFFTNLANICSCKEISDYNMHACTHDILWFTSLDLCESD